MPSLTPSGKQSSRRKTRLAVDEQAVDEHENQLKKEIASSQSVWMVIVSSI